MKRLLVVAFLLGINGITLLAQNSVRDQTVDKITAHEKALVQQLANYTPIAETYIQEMAHVTGDRWAVVRDHYFLSQAKLGPTVDILPFKGTRKSSSLLHAARSILNIKMEFLPEGFAQMAHPDVEDFDREHYSFKRIQTDHFGEVNCLVYDVSPLNRYARRQGMFEGRIWVEDKTYSIIRYKGFLTGGSDGHGYYFHFDSSRVKASSGFWLPAVVYTEETGFGYNRILSLSTAHAHFKAQTRFWGYDPPSDHNESVLLRPDTHTTTAHRRYPGIFAMADLLSDYPLEAQAEDNVANRLESLGLMAPPNEWDYRLEEIVTGIQLANHLRIRPAIRCRELLTTRLEFFTVGHTIVVSRGLLDVSPDDATLAAILALGLARMESGSSDAKYQFADRVLFDPQDTFEKLNFASKPMSRTKTVALAADFLSESPYRDSLPAIHKFFAELAAKSPHIRELVTANLGDSALSEGILPRRGQVAVTAFDRRAALALGSRTRIDPWTDELQILTSAEGSANGQMPFEVTPFPQYADSWHAASAKSAVPTRAGAFSNR